MEQVIRKTVQLSATLSSNGHTPSNIDLHLSSPVVGTTHFKSVYMDLPNEASSALQKLKNQAIDLFGPNVPSEAKYLPHKSLWYGTDDTLRKFAAEQATTGPFSKGEPISLTHLHVIYAPHQDVRSWKIVGTSRLGYDVFIRRTAFIDGKFEAVRQAENWQTAQTLELLPVVNPANGESLGYMEGCDAANADRAIQAASKAFEKYGSSSLEYRVELMQKLIGLIRARSDYLAKLETTDNGKPLKEAQADISDTADCFDFYCGLAQDQVSSQVKSGKTILDTAQLHCEVVHEPVGPCAMILPFNYPLLMAAWKLAPALISGCTVVLKPSEITSATALELAALIHEAGYPAGVVNILPALGPSVGPTLTGSPLIRKIAFTGSGNTGKHILKESTKHLPNVSLELGGKSPLIIFPDANLPAALDWLLMGIFFNAGQVCSATSRLIVHSSIYDKVKKMLLESVSKLSNRVGDGRDESTLMGPLVSQNQLNRVRSMVSKGISEGAKVIVGESNFSGADSQAKGFFFLPTILEDVNDENTLWKDEVFGPVLVMRKFDTEEEALRLANETRFGLAAAVFTEDSETKRRVARKLEVGIVWVNCSQPTLVQAPWGGMKESGVGRELGPWGLDNFLEAKQITSWKTPENYGWYSDL
jgi:betaine-aldehyde dehydrogenase